MPTVLHLSPHPDDELLGVPASLMALRDADWRIVNVACGLGRHDQHFRREAEAREASRRAGFELIVPAHPVALSRSDDLSLARAEIGKLVGNLLVDIRPQIVVSPSPHDRHYAHETVARAVCDALQEAEDVTLRWWLWEIWGGLDFPNVAFGFDSQRMNEILSALEAHSGELERNDYSKLLRGRSLMNVSSGPELVFGFGQPAADAEYVEIFSELSLDSSQWMLSVPRWLEPSDPIGERSNFDVSGWIHQASVTGRFGPPGHGNAR